jgi:hypothetical protein
MLVDLVKKLQGLVLGMVWMEVQDTRVLCSHSFFRPRKPMS